MIRLNLLLLSATLATLISACGGSVDRVEEQGQPRVSSEGSSPTLPKIRSQEDLLQALRSIGQQGRSIRDGAWCKYGSIELTQSMGSGTLPGVVAFGGADGKRRELPVSLTLPVDYPGDLGWVSGSRFLVSGWARNKPASMLFLVEKQEVDDRFRLVMLDRVSYPLIGEAVPVDLIDLSYQSEDGRIYGFDAHGNRIVSAKWTDHALPQALPKAGEWKGPLVESGPTSLRGAAFGRP